MIMLLFIAGITGENRGSPFIKYKEARFTINSLKHKHKKESKKRQNKEKRKKENESTRQSKNSFDNYLIILQLLT